MDGYNCSRVLVVGRWGWCLDTPKISLSRTVPCRVFREQIIVEVVRRGVYVVRHIFLYKAYVGVSWKSRLQPNHPMGWCKTEVNKMVWDGESEPPVVPTIWALLGVSLGGAPVWPCGEGSGFTEESFGRRSPCYLPLEQLTNDSP